MIHKFLDRPVPLVIITNIDERKEELIWLGMELVKLIKGVNNEQNRNTND